MGKAMQGNANFSFRFCVWGVAVRNAGKGQERTSHAKRLALAKRFGQEVGQEVWPRGLAKRLGQEAWPRG